MGTNYGVVSGGRLAAGDGKVAGRACPAPTGGRKVRLAIVAGCAGAGRERAGGGVKTPPYDVGVRRGV